MKKTCLILLIGVLLTPLTNAQNRTYWQQPVDYTMKIDVDVETH